MECYCNLVTRDVTILATLKVIAILTKLATKVTSYPQLMLHIGSLLGLCDNNDDQDIYMAHKDLIVNLAIVYQQWYARST